MNPVRDPTGVARVRACLDQQGELVAAEVGQCVGSVDCASETLRDGGQELVARLVPEAVVHRFEAIQVEHHQRERIRFSPGRQPYRRTDPIVEGCPTWKATALRAGRGLFDQDRPETGCRAPGRVASHGRRTAGPRPRQLSPVALVSLALREPERCLRRTDMARLPERVSVAQRRAIRGCDSPAGRRSVQISRRSSTWRREGRS